MEPRDFLRHILTEADYLLEQSRTLTREQFFEDPTLRRAFARSLEIIGEAAKQVPDEIRRQQPDIEWKGMTGMRDRLIHGYFGVDYELVWDVVQRKIPELRRRIAEMLESRES